MISVALSMIREEAMRNGSDAELLAAFGATDEERGEVQQLANVTEDGAYDFENEDLSGEPDSDLSPIPGLMLPSMGVVGGGDR